MTLKSDEPSHVRDSGQRVVQASDVEHGRHVGDSLAVLSHAVGLHSIQKKLSSRKLKFKIQVARNLAEIHHRDRSLLGEFQACS